MTSIPPDSDSPTNGFDARDFEPPVTSAYRDVAAPDGGVTDDRATGSSDSDSQPKTDTAKEQAARVGSDAKDAASSVAGTAKEQAGQVAGEAKSQAKELYGQATSELRDQAGTQQQRVADGLRSVSDELSSMAEKSDGGGVASELVRNLSGRAGSAASWLDGRDPGSLLHEVKQFAARKPGTFIAIAAGAGILAGRLTKSLAADAKSDAPASSTPSRPESGSTAETRRVDTAHASTSGVASEGYGRTAEPFGVSPAEAASAEPAPTPTFDTVLNGDSGLRLGDER